MQQVDAPNITVIEVNQNQTSSDPSVHEEDYNEDKGIQSDEIIQQVAEEEDQNV